MRALSFTDCAVRVDERGAWLSLLLGKDDIPMARKFVLSKKDRTYTAELKEHREMRSLDANAYFWVLCGQLATATGQKKQDIYRASIREIGGNCDTVCVPGKAVDKIREAWGRNGVGWISDTIPSKLRGCVNVVLYYGSSTYDTAQMSRLIDNIVQDCKAVGIETLPPDKLSLLKEEWSNA